MPIEPIDLCYLALVVCSVAFIGEMLSHKNRRFLACICVLFVATAASAVHFANAQYEAEQATRDAITARYDVDLPDDTDEWAAPFHTSLDGEDVVCDLDGEGAKARLACGSLDAPE